MGHYAVVGSWTMDPAHAAEQERGLREEVVPIVTGSPGFVEGRWTRAVDGGPDVTFIVFDNEGAARSFAEVVAGRADRQREIGIVNDSLQVVELIASA